MEELKPVRCGCGGEANITILHWDIIEDYDAPTYLVECENCEISTKNYDTEAEAIEAWNLAMGVKNINVPDKNANDINVGNKERTAKVTHKPEAFFYRCECGYGLCCEKNDMNYCPSCGARLEWK